MIKFLISNLFDAGTVTAINAADGYPATNVQNRFLKKTWRSTGVSNQWLKFDLGSAQAIADFCMFKNNLTSGATVKIYGHASDLGDLESDWTGTATYEASIADFDSITVYKSLSQTFQWWLISFTDAGNADGYIEIGRVFGGVGQSPTFNFNEQYSGAEIDPSIQKWTIGGHAYSTERERYSEFSISFLDLPKADQDTLRTIWRTVGKTEPFVVIMDGTTEPVNFTRYCLLTSDFSFQGKPYNRMDIPFSFRELR